MGHFPLDTLYMLLIVLNMLKNIQDEMANAYEYLVLCLLINESTTTLMFIMSKFNKLSDWQIIDEKAY